MPRTDPIQGITTALASEIPDGAADEASIVDQMVVKLNMRFATTTTRDAAIATVDRKAGMICYVDTLGYHQCVKTDGGSWVRLAAEDLFTGSEAVVLGSAPTATTQKIRKESTLVASTDANGDISINYIGGPFPNGLVSFIVTPGDYTGATTMVPRVGVSTLTYMWVRCYAPGGTALGASVGVRANYVAVGW